ncbi:MAG TPA: ABC transporter ATP-binding protein [Saprospiraceae bacterium]|nr:ABC transporter ATP-binding protein [Saprospiraceae bacterium]HMX88127.1 ABC transporter ATP-binding protein [Saprospiraceae bacterium]HMZ38906.1 ABC transporter ATP-binding protein [Saprospiraceae bacterium]HNA64936.1 ABC transporter ATP-binding protein [Saprospiraceae bacterium]HNB30495.1 ABC transporter ATP-binding protein [Saprospiraceae bacterium]
MPPIHKIVMIQCRDIYKSYGPIQVLKGVNLDIPAGGLVSIVGSSGAGKSTLLHIMGTLDHADRGELSLMGTRIDGKKEKDLARLRNREIGFIFQFHHLLPELSAIENACLPALIAGFSEEEGRSKAAELLQKLGMGHRMEQQPGTLSGGEQQRVALARALVNRPPILLADEPTGNLDQSNAADVLNLLLDARKEFNLTCVMVTHDMKIAERTEKVLLMKDGIIVG